MTSHWTSAAHASSTQWRDKKRLPVADGPDRADGAVRDAAGRLGAEPARLAHRRAGAVLDRPDPALRPAAGAGPALRPGRAEPARRGDGAAGERQVLPVLHLRLHPVPVRQRDLRRLPVHRVRPELARLRRRAGLGRPRSVWRCRWACSAASASTPRTRWATRRTRWSAGCRKITLAQTCYGHFYIEHNRGHHVRVATPEDPASSRFGETFWEFLPRSVWGSLKSSWELEATRLRRLDKSPWHWSNDVLNAWAMSVVLCGVLIAVFGLALIPYVVISAVFGFTLLETVNYLEHYGLLRQKTRERPLRAVCAGAQLELRSPGDQPVPVPPAAAQRSPRQPDPSLPDAAQHGRARRTCPAATRR